MTVILYSVIESRACCDILVSRLHILSVNILTTPCLLSVNPTTYCFILHLCSCTHTNSHLHPHLHVPYRLYNPHCRLSPTLLAFRTPLSHTAFQPRHNAYLVETTSFFGATSLGPWSRIFTSTNNRFQRPGRHLSNWPGSWIRVLLDASASL